MKFLLISHAYGERPLKIIGVFGDRKRAETIMKILDRYMPTLQNNYEILVLPDHDCISSEYMNLLHECNLLDRELIFGKVKV